MSKRKRTPKVIPETPEPPVKNSVWTHEDKCNLLKGLKTFGHTDIHGISTILVTKSKPAIKVMIHKIMRKAKSVTYNKNPALNMWLQSGTFDDKTSPVPELLKFISLFEEHPTPEESGGFDFKAAYNYLHRMTLGLPPIDLSAETLATINSFIEETRSNIWPTAEKDIVGYLGTINNKNPALKCYPANKKVIFTKAYYWSPMDEESD